MPLLIVQGVSFDASILRRFRSALLKELLKEMDLHTVQFSMLLITGAPFAALWKSVDLNEACSTVREEPRTRQFLDEVMEILDSRVAMR